jgi:methionine synthase I (cobalamin-dependent)
MAGFADRLKAAPVMLTDGGIETRLIYDEGKPEAFAALMSGLLAGGYKVLGGCWGTSDGHIRALARRLTAEIKSRPAG